MFVEAFLPKHLHVRVCPFETLPAFQVIGGLKPSPFLAWSRPFLQGI
jgi:hypothetical protein